MGTDYVIEMLNKLLFRKLPVYNHATYSILALTSASPSSAIVVNLKTDI